MSRRWATTSSTGYDDLVNRVMAPYDATTNPYGGAEWEYIAANVASKSDRQPALRHLDPGLRRHPGRLRRSGDRGPPSLVSPDGIAGIEVTDIVDEVNDAAPTTSRPTAPTSSFCWSTRVRPTTVVRHGDRPDPVRPDRQRRRRHIDAIISGHTHLAYNCSFTVQDWIDRGSGRHEASGGLRRSVRQQPRPADLQLRPDPDGRGGGARRHRRCRCPGSGQLPGRPGDPRSSTTPWPRPPRSVPVSWVRSRGPLTGPSCPTAPPRTAAASRRSATWWPRSSAGQPRPPRRARRKSRS